MFQNRTVIVAAKETAMTENLRLKAARVGAGLTQRQLAEKIGRQEIEVSRFETGRARPDEATKRAIAAVLQKPAFELFDF